MAKASFTFKQTLENYGSYLQNTPQDTDDSALKGDGYVTPPSIVNAPKNSYFTASPVDYGVNRLSWRIGTTLSTTISATPVATEVVLVYDTLGEPQTVADGIQLTVIDTSTATGSMTHGGLPAGTWVYYSLFAKYESTLYRSWYEKVASVYCMVPHNYGSTDMLWDRIPRHYRIQDGSDSGPLGADDYLWGRGQLYRALDIFGWDIDRIRSLAHHQMVTRDPFMATPEALDQLALELGFPMQSQDLGTERLRSALSSINYLRSISGSAKGVAEWITAITGSDCEVIPTNYNALTSTQASCGSVTANTSPGAIPVGNNWVVEPSLNGTATSSSGILFTGDSSSGWNLALAKVAVTNVKNASWYRLNFDVTTQTNASVIGAILSPSVYAVSAFTHASTGSVTDSTGLMRFQLSDGSTDWFQAPLEMGLCGDGTHTTTTMYLQVLVAVGNSGQLRLNNLSLKALDTYPYTLRVYSQRSNLCRDPRFIWGTDYWTKTATGGSVGAYGTTPYLGASTGTGASVTFTSQGTTALGTPFVCGTPYYFTATDMQGTITEVRLVSGTYGTVCSASVPYASKSLSNNSYPSAARKTYRLFRSSGPPWLPHDLEDCYLEIEAALDAGESLLIREPIFEALNPSGDYFDGDTTNGGWLAGATASTGVSDYRWGDIEDGKSFSYYTKDYQRVVSTMYRLWDTIIPVTQTDDPAGVIKWDRLYGYSGTDRP